MTDEEIEFIMDAIDSTASHFREWMTGYYYDRVSNEYTLKAGTAKEQCRIADWFEFGHQADARLAKPLSP